MRTKLRDRKLPNYSIGEERFNYISHIVGGAIGLIALILCLIISAWHRDIMAIATSIVYGITMILFFLAIVSIITIFISISRILKKSIWFFFFEFDMI